MRFLRWQQSRRGAKTPARRGAATPKLLMLEDRVVPAGIMHPDYVISRPAGAPGGNVPFGSPTPVGLTPAQIRLAYGFDSVVFGTVTGDGTGQTIAIVDAYDNPKFVSSTSANFNTSDLH